MRERMMRWTRLRKQLAVVVLDALLSVVSTWLAFSLRLDTLHEPSGAQWLAYGLAPMLAVPIFVRFGLYQAIFRYTGLGAMMAIGNSAMALPASEGKSSLRFPSKTTIWRVTFCSQ